MTFKERNPRFKETVSPLINMRDLYEVYRQDGDGEELEECLHLIKELYERQEPKSLNGLTVNWGEIKGKIFPALLHKEWNEDWLREEKIPYKSYLDFAIILRRISETVSQGIGSLVVTSELIDYWGIEEKKLWDAAWENLKQERFYIQDLNGIVRFETQADGKDIKELDFTNVPSMYVMTNKERYYGARAMLRTDLLKEFAEKVDCNLFILPASTHDIILVPDCGNLKAEKLRQDVREVNAGCVAEQERLFLCIGFFNETKEKLMHIKQSQIEVLKAIRPILEKYKIPMKMLYEMEYILRYEKKRSTDYIAFIVNPIKNDTSEILKELWLYEPEIEIADDNSIPFRRKIKNTIAGRKR